MTNINNNKNFKTIHLKITHNYISTIKIFEKNMN